jgi:hypothetical protein
MSCFFSQVPLVVSYYTEGTPYEEEVKHLRASCERYGIECHIEGILDRGSWEGNCAYKPYFMKDKMEQFQRPLLWVDADAVFVQAMRFEEFMFSDLGIVKYKNVEDVRFCVNAATIYVNATKGGMQALDVWCGYADSIKKAQEKTAPFLDQASLCLLLLAKPPISISLLPVQYCKIFDHDLEGTAKKEIVIEQRQASRRLKERALS